MVVWFAVMLNVGPGHSESSDLPPAQYFSNCFKNMYACVNYSVIFIISDFIKQN